MRSIVVSNLVRWASRKGTNCARAAATCGIVLIFLIAGQAAAQPAISSLSPNGEYAGYPAFTLTVNGSGFASSAVVKWNGSSLSTTYVSSSQLTASVGANLIALAGIFPVTVVSNGATSSPAYYYNYNNVQNVAPSPVTAGGAAFTVTVSGSGFNPGAAVGWSTTFDAGGQGTPLPTNYISSSQLTATLGANAIALAGLVYFTVESGGLSSDAPSIYVDPVASSLNPSTVPAGGPAFTLTVNGIGFGPGVVAQWNGSPLTTTVVSSTQLTASVPANLIATAGDFAISVAWVQSSPCCYNLPSNNVNLTVVTKPSVNCAPAPGNLEVGVPFSTTCQASGGTPPYTWGLGIPRFSPPGSFSATQGATVTYSGTPATSGAYSVPIVLTDSASQSATQTLAGTVYAALTVTSQLPIAAATVGVAFGPVSFAKVTGGTGTYTWSSGTVSLPAGLTMNSSTGAISGTPAANTQGSYALGYSVTDGIGTSTGSYAVGSLVVQPAPTPPSAGCNLAPGPPLEVGVPFSWKCNASGGTPPYSWSTTQVSTGAIPSPVNIGGTFNPTTGAQVTFAGTPAAGGAYSFDVVATDSKGLTSGTGVGTPGYMSSAVYPALQVQSLLPIPDAIVGAAYGPIAFAKASGGANPPYVWSSGTVSLPPGLTMNSSTGMISGTPASGSQGSYALGYSVTDGLGTVSGSYPVGSLVIDTPPSLNSSGSGGSGSGTVGGSPVNLTPTPLNITSSNGSPITFTVSVQINNAVGPNWLIVNVSGYTTPSTLTATANLTGQAPGTLTGTVTLTPTSDSTGKPVVLPFSVGISGSDSLVVNDFPDVNQTLQLTSASTAAGSITVGSSTANAPLYFGASASVTTPLGGNWLSITPSGTQLETPATINVSLQRGSLAPGTYKGSVTILGNQGYSDTVPIALVVPPGPTLAISCSPCTGTAATGQTSTVGSVVVSSSDPTQPIGFTATASSGGGIVPAWLAVVQSGGTAGSSSATLTLSANLQGFAAGTYSGSVTVNPAANSTSGSAQVNFSVTVTGNDSLVFNPTAGQGLQLTTAAPSGTIQVNSSNTNAPLIYSATATVLQPANGNWLKIASGTQTPSSVTVSAVAGSLGPGSYQGRVNFVDTNNDLTSIPVTFVVPGAPTLTAACTASCAGGGATGQSISLGSLNITSSDPTQPVNFTVSASTNNALGPSWLSVGSTTGTATPSGATVPLVANLLDLAQGTYSGSVVITPTSPTANGAQTVTATVTVTSGSLAVTWSAGALLNQPSNLVMALTAPSALAGAINVSAGSAVLDYSYKVQQGANWLQVSPLPPSAPGSLTPGVLTVTASAAGLNPGSYPGQIAIIDSANNTTAVNVTLTVSGPATLLASSTSVAFVQATSAAIPSNQTVNLTASDGSHLGFSVTALPPSWCFATVNQTSTPAVITVGLVPALPTIGVTGTITLTPANGGAALVIKVSFTPPSNTPVVSGGVLNATDGAVDIAQNAWVEIKGNNLAQTTRTWTGNDFINGQMPTMLDGVSATVNNKAAFVYYISPTQVNILTPLDTATGAVPVQVTSQFGTSAVVSATVTPYAPGLFIIYESNNQYPAAQHSTDYSLVGPPGLIPGVTTTPAQPGETIVLYGTGFGLPVTAIVPASLTQTGLLPTPWPAFTIGNVPANVVYASLVTPGLYQFNVIVPASAPNGDNAISATYNGAITQSGLFVPVQHQ